MVLERNMGTTDRIARGVAGIWLLALAISAALAERRLTAVTAAIAGLGLIGNAASGFCGGNRALGIDTSTDADRDRTGTGGCVSARRSGADGRCDRR